MKPQSSKMKWIMIFFGLTILVNRPALADKGGDEIPPPPAGTPIPYPYKIPQKLSDGWEVGDLRGENVNFKKIHGQVELIFQNELAAIHSLLIFRHGKLILEEYSPMFGPDSLQPLFSVTKSVFSAVYGTAQDQGLLSVDQKLYDLYPEERSKAGWDKRKEDIKIGNLLSMNSGLNNGPDGSMAASADWVAHCLGQPLELAPGTAWIYDGVFLTLVSNLISKKSGMSFPDFAKKYLFGPLGLGAQEETWVTGPGGVNRVDYGLYWKARDMGKLGQLYLNQGMWRGKRILSEAWVKEATSPYVPLAKGSYVSYGYLWYVTHPRWKDKSVQVFNATGLQGQEIYVCPDADLVCVITAGSSDDQIYGKLDTFFQKEILGSFN